MAILTSCQSEHKRQVNMSYLLNYDQKSLTDVINSVGGMEAFLNGPMGVAPILSSKDAAMPDSMKPWMHRYEQYTHEDLEQVGSYAAIEY